jgi:glycine/D-amino acid oxidase-like deaminating enzyme/nitrite reductase/ring-hydroxylating ferredoxin subunit
MKRKLLTTAAKKDSIWAATAKMPTCGRLTESLETDVCIVGAGIAGLTTGYLLTQAGKRVVILDDGPLAGGMTQVTTAHLSSAIDDRFVKIEWWHGERGSRLAAESHAAAIDRIESMVNELGVECDFVRLDGYLFLAPGDDEDLLDAELAAARRAGVAVEKVAQAPLTGYDAGPCLRFPRQARFHPCKYLAAVAEAIREDGGRLFTKSHVESIAGGASATVKAGPYKIRANSVVVATNSPINDMVAMHTKQAPYMTYVVGARVPRDAVTDALYWDTEKAYHYVRLQELDDAAEDLLIIGGEDHKSGQDDDAGERHARLEAWGRERFPMMGKIEYKWGGQCMETIDGLAFIGRNPWDDDNVFIVTGDSGMGMTHGTIAGMLLTDLILNRPNPWERLYDPARKTLRAATTFVKENLNVAAQYADWLTGGEVGSVEEIPRGGGAVVRRGLSKVAISRDADGKLTELSAVCPHLGCIVHWNEAETSWDCPCHGSRFQADGKVVNGPANVDLSSA